MHLRRIFPVCRCSSHCANSVFYKVKTFKFDKLQLVTFIISWVTVWLLCLKLITKAKIAYISSSFLWKRQTILLNVYFYNLLWVHLGKKPTVSPLSGCLFMYVLSRCPLVLSLRKGCLFCTESTLRLCQTPINYTCASLPMVSTLSHLSLCLGFL